jgi:chitin synthase
MIVFAIINNSLGVVPLILIVIMIGLPAVLIVLTTRKWVYVLWMLSKSTDFILQYGLPLFLL